MRAFALAAALLLAYTLAATAQGGKPWRQVEGWDVALEPSFLACRISKTIASVTLVFGKDDRGAGWTSFMAALSPQWRWANGGETYPLVVHLPPALPRGTAVHGVNGQAAGFYWSDADRDLLYDLERSSQLRIEPSQGRPVTLELGDMRAVLAAREECDRVHQAMMPPKPKASDRKPSPPPDARAKPDEEWEVGAGRNCFLARRDAAGLQFMARAVDEDFYVLELARPGWDWLESGASYHIAFRLQPSGEAQGHIVGSVPGFSNRFSLNDRTGRGLIDALARNRTATLERRGQEIARLDLRGLAAALAKTDRCQKALNAEPDGKK